MKNKIYNSIRKPSAPPTKVFKDKKKENLISSISRDYEIPKGYNLTDKKCKECGNKLTFKRIESFDGAYEDFHYICPNCDDSFWIDGVDY